eukprot:SAG31_NODE_1598_length_7798_cov_7.682167_7_plen_305_part_00
MHSPGGEVSLSPRELQPSSQLDTAEAEAAPEAAPIRISIALLEEAVLPDGFVGSMEERAERMFQTRKLRLKGRNIAAIENLEMFTALEYLYLGHNQIERLQNLEFHPNLHFLTINHNRLASLAGIEALPNLKHLNAAANLLEDLPEIIGVLPEGLQDLHLAGNPSALVEDYRRQLVGALPELVELDDVLVTNAELAAFGFETAEEEISPSETQEHRTADRIDEAGRRPPAYASDGGIALAGNGLTTEPTSTPTEETPSMMTSLNFEATADAMAEQVLAPFREHRRAMSERSKQRQQQLLSEMPQ